SPEQHAAYSTIIDRILSEADLDTVSAKAIRRGLQEQVDYDLAPQKSAITALIMERFDKFQRDRAEGNHSAVESAPTTNGATHVNGKDHVADTVEDASSVSPSNKRKATEESDDELSDVKDTPPVKKVKKAPKPETETDEQIARRLQAEFSQPSRSTRGGGASSNKKKPAARTKKEKKPKKKSAAKINSDDDSEVDGFSSPKPQKEKKGGFHKPLNLSPALQELLGESQLSRPETVKRIWAYVKERDLQDPSDKRQIRCDDKMRQVFKSDKVHMFTMNKVLAQQLYPIDQ
ncbi:SWI complex, BAF60b domains, partial [Teratosphaeria destructans]